MYCIVVSRFVSDPFSLRARGGWGDYVVPQLPGVTPSPMHAEAPLTCRLRQHQSQQLAGTKGFLGRMCFFELNGATDCAKLAKIMGHH